MALAILDKQNIDAPTADYPFGRPRDKTPGIGGTPANLMTNGDWHQFFAKLMDYAGVIPNGLPDNEYSGWQLMEALTSLMGGMKTKVLPIGAWDMNTDVSVNVPHGLTGGSQIREISAIIYDDSGASVGNLVGAGFTGTLGGAIGASATDIGLSRVIAGGFDSASYSNSSVNRGYVVLRYVEDL